jgi:hypothetical protein
LAPFEASPEEMGGYPMERDDALLKKNVFWLLWTVAVMLILASAIAYGSDIYVPTNEPTIADHAACCTPPH